uniref:Uncharacterized protein n=1 Tax=Alexandrium catenella TaxID=2925 RepID=A0A7S1QJ88_ALECA|mmetsp:Transcript_33277/g.90118  ORF Transcript_33277/g.90118 Transcript_33277/m.90118 type:complete len:378 (+) Transcript_33277:54-1187(+)
MGANIGNFGNFALEEAASALEDNTATAVDVREVDSDGARRLAAALAGNRMVESLAIRGKPGMDVEQICAALARNDSIAAFHLSGTQLDTRSAELLAAALAENSSVTSLNLAGNGIDFEGTKLLVAVSAMNGRIASLNLSGNSLGVTGAECLAAALLQNNTMTSLDLAGGKIGTQGAKSLAAALARNKTVTSLGLAGNEFGAEGAKHLALALAENGCVTTLDLSRNNIGTAGAEHLAAGLVQNSSLTSLDLCHNMIDFQGAEFLAEALEENCSIKSLELTGAYKRIAAALERNKMGSLVLTATCESREFKKWVIMCTTIGGSQAARVEIEPTETMACLKSAVIAQTAHPGSLLLVRPDATRLCDLRSQIGDSFAADEA